MSTVALLRPPTQQEVQRRLREDPNILLVCRQEGTGQRYFASWQVEGPAFPEHEAALGDAIQSLHRLGKVYLVEDPRLGWTHRVYSVTDANGRVCL